MSRHVCNSWKEERIIPSSILKVLPYTSQFTQMQLILRCPLVWTVEKKCTSLKTVTNHTKWRRTAVTCKTFYTKKHYVCTQHGVRYVYWARYTIWWLWKLESTLVHRVMWRSLYEIIVNMNCRCLLKHGRDSTSSVGIFTSCETNTRTIL